MVVDVAVDRSQTVAYVLDRSEPFIHAIPIRGAVARRFGRAGTGPGDLQRALRLGWIGDTLWIADPSQNRLSTFDPTGRPLRAVTVLGEGGGTDPALVLAIGSGWTAILKTRNLAAPRRLGAGVPMLIVRASTRGATLDTLLRFDEKNQYLTVPIRVDGVAGFWRAEQPFNDDPLVYAAKDGTGVVVVDRISSVAPFQSRFSVTRIGSRGDTLFTTFIPYVPTPVDDRAVAAQIERLGRLLFRPRSRTVVIDGEGLEQFLYRPAFVPPVSDVILGRSGAVWLRRESPQARATGQPYLILDDVGRPAATVTVPLGERVVESTTQRVWTVAEGEDGVSLLKWYLIARGR